MQISHYHSQFDSAGIDTLLVVENNKAMRHYICESLRPTFKILTATDGVQAINMVIQHNPSLVMYNLRIPGLIRFELCKKLKSNINTNHIPVIVLTGTSDVEVNIEGFRSGADDLIPNPFRVKELEARIRNLIDNRKKLKARFERQIDSQPNEINIPSIEEKFIKSVTDVVVKNIGNAEFTVHQFAREIGVSTAQLYRKLFTLTGEAPNVFIRNMRLEYASHLLTKRAGNVAEVAFQVGFLNLSYFSKCFKNKYRVLPSEFTRGKTTTFI